jgi:hypothetical protein
VGFVYVRATGIEESRHPEDSWCWLASSSSSSNPHQSQIGRKRKGERIGSGSDDGYVVRRAQISGVDSRWRDIWDPKPGTGALFCPEGCREWMTLPGSCSSESNMLISSRRRERFGRVRNRFGWYIPKISG